jgi:hippurate hydrolase
MDASLAEKLTGWRRHLHAHPELSLHESATAAFVKEKLTELGIPFVADIGGHGVVATLARAGSNRSVGLRAGMDALPITETTGLDHASTIPGVMHACGHDGHTTSLLGAAALLKDDPSWTGTVHLVFQPAEEGSGGARAMIADGLFTRFPMDRIFGYHNWPGLEAGTIAVHPGPVMAAGARLQITIDGHAGHAAMPHQTRDPMVAAGHLLVALQSIVARNVDPMEAGVITIGMIEGGVAANQIPAQVTLRGTCRSYSATTRQVIDDGIRRVSAGIAAMFGVEVTVEIRHGVSATVNAPEGAELAAEAARSAGLKLRRDLPPAMTGEDFGWMLEAVPGAYVWIGNGPAEPGRELHNPGYDYNDAILPAAAGFLASVAKQSLSTG